MTKQVKKSVTLFVPTRNRDEIKASISAGADALTIPIHQYNRNLLNICKIHDVSVYLLIQNAVTDNEFSSYIDIINTAWQDGIDGIYLFDTGFAYYVKHVVPDIHVIVSPRSELSNSEAIKHYQAMDTIILPPELSKESLLDLRKKVTCNLGTIVHGSLEKFYGFVFRNNIQSPEQSYCRPPKVPMQELCLIEHIPELMIRGVTTLIVLPNGKAPYFLYTIIEMYRKAIDSIMSNDFEVTPEMKKMLMLTSLRKQSEGLFNRKKDISKGMVNSSGVYLGTVLKNTIRLEDTLYKGDRILVRSGRKDVILKIKYILNQNRQKLYEAHAGDIIHLRFPQFKPGKKIYRVLMSDDLEYPQKKVMITVDVRLVKGRPLEVVFRHQGVSVELKGTIPAIKAKNVEVTSERISEQFSRMYQTPFEVEKYTGKVDPGLFIPFSELNTLRQQAVDQLTEEMTKSYRRQRTDISYTDARSPSPKKKVELYCRVYSYEDVTEAVRAGADLIYYDIFATDVTDVQEYCKLNNVDLFLSTPRIIHEHELEHILKLINHYDPKGILVGNAALLTKKIGTQKHLDYNFQVSNSETLSFWNVPAIVSSRLGDSDVKDLAGSNIIFFAHGKVILINTRYELSNREERWLVQKTPYGDTIIKSPYEIRMIDKVAGLKEKGIHAFYLDLEDNVYETVRRYRSVLLERETVDDTKAVNS